MAKRLHLRRQGGLRLSEGFILDLFCGIHGAGRGFLAHGFKVVGIEKNAKLSEQILEPYEAVHYLDLFDVTERDIKDLIAEHGPCLAVWASPPCTGFSVASCSHHWNPPAPDGTREPKTDFARLSVDLVNHTLQVIEWTEAPWFWIENPRGILRKLGILDHLQHTTINYCVYGEDRQKPTDLWGRWPASWTPRPPCGARSNNVETVVIDGIEWVPHADDPKGHVVARRGMSTGTQGIKGNAARSVVAFELTHEIAGALLNADAHDPMEAWL